MSAAKEKRNYSPPAWEVLHYDLSLRPDLAERFKALRQRLCDEAGDNHINRPDVHYNQLLNQAVELLCDQAEQRLLLQRAYGGFESIVDLEQDVAECLEGALPGEFQGTVHVRVAYEPEDDE